MTSNPPSQVTDNSSDSSNAMSSSSDSDKPRTSPPSSPIHRKTNSRSTVAASRIPRLRATSFTSRPFSPPSTPIDTAKSEPLDWGLAGEWRRLSGSTKQDSAEMDPDLDEGGALLAERADDCQVAPTSPSTVAKIVPAQSVTVSSGLFGDDGSNFSELGQLSSYGESEEVIDGDDTQLLSASSNLEHAPDTGEPAEVLPPATIRGPFLSIPTKNLSAAEVSHSAASRDPSENGQPATIEEPFSSIATNDILNKDSAPSPQAILRGLIRDAHQHTMYFTLAHSHFSLDDLRDGLDYAYSMLQAATSKRSLLRMLRDDTVDMNTAELRSWITRVDHLDDPLTGYEPHMSVVFESASPVEMKLAIAEFIESRRTVEDEFKQMRVLLMKRVVAGEKSMQCKISSDNGSVGDGDEAETIMLTGEVRDAWDDSWDGLVTVTMLITLALIYLCVRE